MYLSRISAKIQPKPRKFVHY